MDLLNKDVIRYIIEFLIYCKQCGTFQIPHKSCCICKQTYCETCKETLVTIHSFYENTYCNECHHALIA